MAKSKAKRSGDDGGAKKSVFVRYISSFVYTNILELYIENQEFRRAVDSGRYAFIDGRIVLNAPQYISYIDGRMTLRDNISEEEQFYCLHYRRQYEYSGGSYGRKGFSLPKRANHMVRGHRAGRIGGRRVIKSELEDAKKISSVNDVTFDNMIGIVGGGHGPGENFSEALARFMNERGITEEELAELTGLAPKTIQRMRNPNFHPSLKSVIAVCVGLSLDLYNSIYLVHLAGFELTNSREDKVYYFILGFAYKDTVYDCNRMLERLHMKTLTKL